MGIQEGEVERIKQGSRLEDLVTRDVPETNHSGDGFLCSSPFRRDRNPSFFVSIDRQFWFDHGTGESGDVVDYVRKKDGCEFVEALKTLCETFGLEPLRFVKDQGFNPTDYSARQKILEIAADYYEKLLWDREDVRQAMQRTHGLVEDRLAEYRAGWADGKLHLQIEDAYPRVFTVEQLLSTGLFYQRNNGLVDVFNQRGIFPYLRNGKAEFFIGRRYDGLSLDVNQHPYERAKYKKQLTHSPKYPYVLKGAPHPLFGLDTVRVAKESDILVVTEGVTDAISAMEAGLKVISPVTVAFRKADYEPILRIAKRFNRVVIFNDLGDREDSGKKGAVKTAIYLHTNDIDVRLINAEALGIDEPTKGNKVDLNKFFVDHGAEAVKQAVERAPKLPEFLIEEIPEAAKEDPQGLVKQLEPVFMLLKESDEITADILSQKVSKRFGIKKSIVDKKVHAARLEDEQEKKEEEKQEASTDPDPFAPAADATIEIDVTNLDLEIRGKVLKGNGCYLGYKKSNEEMSDDGAYEDSDKNLQIISNFVFEPHQLLINEEGDEELSVYICMNDGGRLGPVAVPPITWSSISRFREFFSKFGKPWFNGTSDNVSYLKGDISLSTKEVLYTRSRIEYTEHEGERLFVWPGGVLGPDGIRTDVNLRWYAKPNPLAKDLKLHEEDDIWEESDLKLLAAEALPLILEVNEPHVIYTLLGWTYACPFSPQIKDAMGMFPLLWLWATHGAGKTTIGNLVSRLTGQSGGMKICSMSSFAFIKELASSSVVPLLVDEYRDDMPRIQKNNLLEKARATSNADSSLAKGTASQQLIIYELGRPLLIGGESPPDDPATLERCLVCQPSKNAVSVERQMIFQKLQTLPLWRLARSFYQFAFTRDLQAELKLAMAEMEHLETAAGLSRGRIPLRNRNALIVMLFGLNQFSAWAASLDVKVPLHMNTDTFSHIVSKCLGVDELTKAEDGTTSLPAPRTTLSEFLETMLTMAQSGHLEHGTHYYKVSGHLVFHFNQVYDLYLEHLRRTGAQEGVRAGKRALHAQMTEDMNGGGVVVHKTWSHLGFWGTDKKFSKLCVRINLAKFSELISSEEFPGTEDFHQPDKTASDDWGKN